MALFDAIKISELPPTELVFKDDLMVVDRLQAGKTYVTNAVRLGKLGDYLTTLDLNFTGNVTFNNTIQPLPGNNLDAIFDNVNIRQSITLDEGVEVNGLYLDNLEDVTIDSPVVGDIIMYTNDPLTRESGFINVPGITEAPKDGKIYARSNGSWVDITDCLRCPTQSIGNVIILRVDGQSLDTGSTHTYRASTPIADSSLTDLIYRWTANSNQVIFTSPTSQSTNVVFVEPGMYILTCEVSSGLAIDSPQYGRITTNLEIPETYRVLVDPTGEYIVTELGAPLQFEPSDY